MFFERLKECIEILIEHGDKLNLSNEEYETLHDLIYEIDYKINEEMNENMISEG